MVLYYGDLFVILAKIANFYRSRRRSARACAKRPNSSIMALVHSEGQDRWYFTKEELQRTPSALSGIDTAKELSYRQQSANLIQDMGQRLLVYPSFKIAYVFVTQTGILREISVYFINLSHILVDILIEVLFNRLLLFP